MCDFRLVVSPRLSISAAVRTSRLVRERVVEKVPQLGDVTVILDPNLDLSGSLSSGSGDEAEKGTVKSESHAEIKEKVLKIATEACPKDVSVWNCTLFFPSDHHVAIDLSIATVPGRTVRFFCG